MRDRPPGVDPDPAPARGPVLVALAGIALAMIGLIAAAASGSPYLGLDDLNPWMAVFAIGAFGALFAAPFAIQRTFFAEIPESERRWERAVLAWGAIALAAGTAGALLIAAGGFDGDSLAGSAGIVLAGESLCVLAAVATMMLEG